MNVFLRKMILVPWIAFLAAACTDMGDQPSFKPQEAPRRAPPAESVPVSGVVRPMPGHVQAPPFDDSPEARARGGELFAVNCAFCHGGRAEGDGPVGRKLDPPPPGLHTPVVQQLGADEIVLRLTYGWGRMPAFGNRLSVEDRWRLVYYVRALDE